MPIGKQEYGKMNPNEGKTHMIMLKKAVRVLCATCISVTMVAFAQDADIVKVRGKGIGTTKLAALNDAYRDAVERAVGLYVDAEQMLKNDELVKDQILTQSNAYIENYEVARETKTADGLVEIQILASVRKTALTRKISVVMPATTYALGGGLQNAHARISTKEKRNSDAASLLANALEGLDPFVASMECSLASSDAAIKETRNPQEQNNTVTASWLFRTCINQKRFLEVTVPRLQGVLAQISLSPPRSVTIPVNPASTVNVPAIVANSSSSSKRRGPRYAMEAHTQKPSLKVEKLNDESAALFLLITGGNNFRTVYSGIIYEIDSESARVVSDWLKTLRASPTFAVSLLDAGGGTVTNGKIRPLGTTHRVDAGVWLSPPPRSRSNPRRNSGNYHYFVLAPWITGRGNGSGRGNGMIDFESYSWQEFVLLKDAIPEVKNMRIEIIQ